MSADATPIGPPPSVLSTLLGPPSPPSEPGIRPTRGVYINLEGPDGVGKTSQARLLAERLNVEGNRAWLSAQPTHDTPIGKLIRAALRHEISLRDRRTLPLLFAADRQEHSCEIRDKLAEGLIVVGDRGALSTWAYATAAARAAEDPYAHGVSVWSDALSEFAVQPSLVIVLALSADECARRRGERGGSKELFEVDAIQRHVVACYEQADSTRLGRVVQWVDARGSVEEVHGRAMRVVRRLLEQRGQVWR